MHAVSVVMAFLADTELPISKTVSAKSDFFFFLIHLHLISFNSIDEYSDSQNIYLYG